MRRPTRAIGRLALPLLLATALACARPAARPTPLDAGDARPRAWVAALAHEAASRRSLRGLARVALDGPAGSGRAAQVLLLERPARLRVEVLGLLDQTLAVLATDGERYQLFRAEDGSVTDGEVHAALLYEVAGLALTPEEAVALLLAAPPLPSEARIAGAAALPEGGVRVDLQADAGALDRLRLDFDAGARLRAASALAADGSARWEARYDEWRPAGAAAFPHAIEVRDGETEARARLEFRRVELNPALPPEAFVLPARSAR